jgi:SCY1-like protein 2
MGNAVSSQFEVKEQVASGGPSHLWKVNHATRRSTGQATAVFLFDKKVMETLNPLSKGSAMLKKDQDRMCELLKKEAQTLSRLRHPSFLEVTEALNDSPLALAFATEPLLVGLSNALGELRNFDVANKSEFKERFELDEVEVGITSKHKCCYVDLVGAVPYGQHLVSPMLNCWRHASRLNGLISSYE